MARGLIAGGTNYSGQAFSELEKDLRQWVKALREVSGTIRQNVTDLQANDYWRDIPSDVQAMVGRSLELFATGEAEITEILDDFQSEVRQDHVKRLRRIGSESVEVNHTWGDVWHGAGGKSRLPAAYASDDFFRVESIYGDARDMAADLMDLTNLTHRLEDFVGRRPPRVLTLEPSAYGVGINVRRLGRKLISWFKGRRK